MLSFLAVPASAAYALIAAVAAIICLLFLIKPARLRATISSALIWRRVLGQRRVRDRRRRWIVSLLLSLLIGLSLALAATRPQLWTLGASAQRVVVVLDNTVSMSARTADGHSRWERAVAAAHDLIRQLGSTHEVLLLDTAGRDAPTGFVPRHEALEQLARMGLSSRTDGLVPPLPVGDRISGAYLFTDGVGVGAVPPGVTVRSVFEAADNVAITGFEARAVPGAPTRYEAFLQIANTSATAKSVALEVLGGAGFHVARELQVAGETTINLTLDVTHFDQGPLRARITAPGDAFELDDSAYCVVLPHRLRRVLLVTAGNQLLEDSLRLLPGVALTVHSPGRHALPPQFDTYVLDRYAPSEPPAAGALLFRPPNAEWLDAKWHAVGRLTKLGWDDTHALSAGVPWRDVRLEAAQLASASDGRAVVTARPGSGNEEALILTGDARARWVAVGFALQDSNLPLQAGFPVFLGTALNWLNEGPTVVSASVGWVELPVPDAEVFEGTGGRVSSTHTPNRTLFEAPRPGVYMVGGGREQLVVVVNANDVRMAQINRQRIRVDPSGQDAQSGGSVSWPEPGIWLLGIALMLLVAEWAAFSRRVTE